MANIFEQYGIKEVADVTIYAIDLDKYDNEIYIPVMYLDTLKVSTLEQTAEQTTANGGKGNPDLITWDYGKEISLSLEDALFTPASQSLMWGGKFGIKKPKVQGLWNPLVYPTDNYGRTSYLRKIVLTYLEEEGTPSGFYETINGVKIEQVPILACQKLTDNVYLGAIDDGNGDSIENTYGVYYDQSYTELARESDQSVPPASEISLTGRITNIQLSNTSRFLYTDENTHQSFIFSIIDNISEQSYRDYMNIISKAIIDPDWAAEQGYIVRGSLAELALPASNSSTYCKNHIGELGVYSRSNFIMEAPSNELKEIIDSKVWDVFKEYIAFICPCDGEIKYARYEPIEADYKYENIDEYATGYKCPKGYQTGERATDEDMEANLVESYYWNIGTNSIYRGLKIKSMSPGYKGRPERAEIIIDNYNQFEFNTYDMSVLKGTLSGNVIELDDAAATNFCIYTPIPACDQILGDGSSVCGSNVSAYGYEWKNTDMKMVSLEGEQDMYYLENANLRFRLPRNSTQKEVMIAREGFYETEVTNENLDPTHSGKDKWTIVDINNELTDIIKLTRQYTEQQSYGYEVNPYSASLDFYLQIKLLLPGLEPNNSLEYTVRVPIGRFYIIADWNFGTETPYDMMHPINSGMDNVYVLERTEKCKATRTFAIDANKNLAMANYRNMQQYSNTELTVFIDPKTMKPFEPNSSTFIRESGDIITGNLTIIKQNSIYYKWTRTIAPDYTTLGHQIIVDAEHFPGTYRIVGETYARSRDDGKDQRYQFEIPLAKLSSNTNLTLQADGDPTTFTMDFKVLRRDDGVMMKLTQYNVDCNDYDGYMSGSTKIIPTDIIDNDYDTAYVSISTAEIKLIDPEERTIEITADNNTDTENVRAGMNVDTSFIIDKFNMNTLNSLETDVTNTSDFSELDSNEFIVDITNQEVESE